MKNIYYHAAHTDSGCLMACGHEHRTVSAAAACISSAGGYVVGVENRALRALTDAEEVEFQNAMYGKVESRQNSTSDYVLIIRVTLGSSQGFC